MDRTPLYRFLLACFGVTIATAHVQPPANVTLHCHNLNNVLKWDHSQETSGLKYRVDIGVYDSQNAEDFPNVTWVEPPAREANLSFLSDPTQIYFLTVTAVLGDKESDSAPLEGGITFSYCRNPDVDQKCSVDFPSATVTSPSPGEVQLSFPHPWLLCTEKPKTGGEEEESYGAEESNPLPTFHYEVMIKNQEQKAPHSLSCEEEVCEGLVPVDPAQEEHCLQITGDLEDMLSSDNRVYCVLSPLALADENYKYIIIAVTVLAAAGLIFGMVYFKKTKPSTETFSSQGTNFRALDQQKTLQPVADMICSPTLSPLLPTMEMEGSTDVAPAVSSQDDFRMPLGLPPEHRGVSGGVSGGGLVAQPSEDVAAYTSGAGLDEDNASSGYEKRDVVVQLGPNPDDLAGGYRGKTK